VKAVRATLAQPGPQVGRPLAKRSQAQRVAELDLAVAESFMRAALDEAAKGLGRTHPNPVVGAVVVKGGRVVSRGFHQKAGAPHAEVVALTAAGAKARGADLYTTLEPCAHFGRTPPCSEAILKAGIKRVFCASADPNPLVNGKGVARLRRQGVEVVTGVLRDEADRLNRPFFKHVRTGLPWVTLKAAVTLDGKLASATGDSKWVSGAASRERVHGLRDRVDAILVGANTVRSDDPRLTTRLPQGEGKDPLRIVVDSRLSLSPTLKLFTQRSAAKTVVATLAAPGGRRAKALTRAGAEVWQVQGQGKGNGQQVDLPALLKRLGQEGLTHVLVEGGAELFGSLVRTGLADELWLFIAPKLLGGDARSWLGALGIERMADAIPLRELRWEASGEDLLLRARFEQEAGR